MLRRTSRDGNLASLDVLRGLAIASVLISHFWPPGWPASKLLPIFFGQFGVTLFFFLSGFLMDRIYVVQPAILPFLIRRSFRILPLYWLSILIIFAAEPGWTPHDVMSNAIFATAPLHSERMSGVYWTLYIEVLFYATIPAIFFFGRCAILFGPYAAMGLFGLLWFAGVRSGVALHYLAYCYLGLQFGSWQRGEISQSALLCSVTAVVIAASALPILAPFPDIVSPLFGFVPLVCAMLLLRALRSPFRARPLEFLGDVSYSLYLLHLIVFSELSHRLSLFGHASWFIAIAAAGLAIVLSALSLILLERPAIAVGRRIAAQAAGSRRSSRTTHLSAASFGVVAAPESTAPVNRKTRFPARH